MLFMKCVLFTLALHFLRAAEASTKSGLRPLEIRRALQDYCSWLNYSAQDFREASTDINADTYTPECDYITFYYEYSQCYDLDYATFQQLLVNIGNCLPEQVLQDDDTHDGENYSCNTVTSTTRAGCCLGNDTYVVFEYKNQTSQCDIRYTYIRPTVFPSATICADHYGDSLTCGSCSQSNIKEDSNEELNPNGNVNGSSSIAFGCSWMILAMTSLLMILLQV